MRSLVIVAVLAAASPASAGQDDLDEALVLKQQLDFDGALAKVRAGIAAGDNDDAVLAALYRLQGELEAGLERPAAAIDAFKRAFVLAGPIALEAGASPKIKAPFDEAEAWVADNGMLLITTRDDVVVIANDPLQMVSRARVDGAPRSIAGNELRVDLPARVELLDTHGNVLRVVDTRAPGVLVVEPRPRPPAFARFEIWGLAAVGGLLVAGVEAIRLVAYQAEWDRLRGQDGQHDFSELRSVERSGRAAALGANIGLGVAAVFATVSAFCAWKEFRVDRHEGGAGLSYVVEF